MVARMHNQIWTELAIELPAEHVDAVSDFLVSLTGRGVLVEDVQEGGKDYHERIRAYLTQKDKELGLLQAIEEYLGDLRKIHSDFPEIRLSARMISEEDWSENWKRYFRPIRVGRCLVIKPSWETYVPRRGDVVVEIDPGQAFGTGTHVTTAMILEAMEALWEREGWLRAGDWGQEQGGGSPAFRLRVLDVGTGTGILGIVAARLGASSVLGIDVDPDAVDIARENVRRNHVHLCMTVSMTPLWQIGETFHLILANLDRDTLILLAKDMVDRLEEGGYVLLSGVLVEQKEAILECLGGQGLTCLEERIDPEGGEWIAMVMGRAKSGAFGFRSVTGRGGDSDSSISDTQRDANRS